MRKNRSWKLEVAFVPFESDEKRNIAYREWIRVFLIGKMTEIVHRNNKEPETCSNQED